MLDFLASEAPQLQLSREGSPSTLANEEIHEQYAANLIPEDRDYNTASIFKHPYAEPPLYSRWDADLPNFLNEKVTEFLESEDDVNTFLRKMEDEYSVIVTERMEQE